MNRTVLICCLLLIAAVSRAQTGTDTLRLTLPQAEQQFIRQNLNLLATRLGIDENRAYEMQARLLPNPTVYVEQMPYNAHTREFMPVKQSNSEQVIQVQQLILLAGKRNKQLALSATQTRMAADRFEDLVRTLTFQLRSTFYDLYFTQQALGVYEQELATLQRTVDLYQQQYNKGNVPLKDLARLKAYLFNLSTEQQQQLARIADDGATLAVLLNTPPNVSISAVVEAAALTAQNPASLRADTLLARAEVNRPDLRAVREQTTFERQNLALQKALAVPDLSLQGTYDRNAGYIPNYVGVGIGISLPLLNRNQGNIRAAEVRNQSSRQALSAYQLQVEADVWNALTKARQADQLYRTFDRRFNDDFGRLIQGVIENYRKQNIDVVEFLDFFDAYKSNQIQYNQLQNNRLQRFEELNLAVGQQVL
ncbi:TolC family protein [Tellurirhabdus rosea]|uniref:TolC family protein n=1 Tax=Tellurirhabdus rosea TaxID=2674997 RepID=UPI002252F55B|nr:TolC family protein [Tellurirhabdus rosea]